MARQSVQLYPNLDHLNLAAPVSMFTGKMGTGKTEMVMNALGRCMSRPGGPLFQDLVILTPTGSQPVFDGWDKRHIHQDPERWTEVIQSLIKFQTAVIERDRRARKNVLLILDDCIGAIAPGREGGLFKQQMTKLMSSGRQFGITVWLCVQTLASSYFADPGTRGAACNIISFEIMDSSRERLVGMLGGIDKKTAAAYISKAWEEKYRCICFNSEAEPAKRISFAKLSGYRPKLILRWG